jgi:hypothetical protein
MAVHEKKIWPEFFDRVQRGEKTFEVRLADEDYQAGDTLVLREWDPQRKEYTGRSARFLIPYVSLTQDQARHYPAEALSRYGLAILALQPEPKA